MTVERRQLKQAINNQATQRWHRKLFRAAGGLKKLIEQRKRFIRGKSQANLARNGEAIERWQRRLFRAVTELRKLTEQRKRILKGPGSGPKLKTIPLTGMGGRGVEHNDSLEGL